MQPRMTREEALAALSTMTDDDFPTVSNEEAGVDPATVDRLIATVHRLAGRPSLTAPGQQSPRINLRIPQALKDRLSEVARLQNRCESDIARDALRQYLNVPV